VTKHSPRISLLGTIDELNAALGVARAADPPDPVKTIVARLQNQLFQLGTEVAVPKKALNKAQAEVAVPKKEAEKAPATPHRRKTGSLREADVAMLEKDIDRCEKSLPPLQAFILPGGHPAAAQLHLARAICRRAERDLTLLAQQEAVSGTLLEYLNRTSDLLFVLARTANKNAGVADIEWNTPP